MDNVVNVVKEYWVYICLILFCVVGIAVIILDSSSNDLEHQIKRCVEVMSLNEQQCRFMIDNHIYTVNK